MLPRIDPAPVSDAAPADWLKDRLEFRRRVRHWIPVSYEAYAHVLHPASIYRRQGEDSVDRAASWAEIAAWSGKELRPTSNFMDLQVRSDGASWRDGDTDVEHKNAAYEGQLVRPQIDRLSEHLAGPLEGPNGPRLPPREPPSIEILLKETPKWPKRGGI